MKGCTIHMPVDVGDRVFCAVSYRANGAALEYEVTNFMISKNKKGVVKKRACAMWVVNGRTVNVPLDFSPEDIGVTVFTTREEAERRANELHQYRQNP